MKDRADQGHQRTDPRQRSNALLGNSRVACNVQARALQEEGHR